MAMQNLMMRQMKLARPRNIMMSIRGGDKELTAKALDFCSKLAYELRLELDNETRLCNKNKQQRSWSWNAAQRPRSNKIEGSSQKQAGRVAVFSGTPGNRIEFTKKYTTKTQCRKYSLTTDLTPSAHAEACVLQRAHLPPQGCRGRESQCQGGCVAR